MNAIGFNLDLKNYSGIEFQLKTEEIIKSMITPEYFCWYYRNPDLKRSEVLQERNSN